MQRSIPIENRGELHITIGATPQVFEDQGTQKISLENDLRLTKAALLYADQVKLVSIVSAALLEIAAIGDVPKEKRFPLLKRLQSYANDPESENQLAILTSFYEEARRKRHSKKGRILLQKFDAALSELGRGCGIRRECRA